VSRRVVVTGGTRGIGAAVAARFAAAGDDVVAVGRAQCDVTDEAAVAALFERVGTVDVLVNNAGLTNTERHFLEADADWWERIIAVNLSGAFLCGRRAAQVMARKRSGAIINMSSGGASRAHRGNAAYDAAKGGIEALTRALALDLGYYGVRVCTLVPGSIDTSGLPEEERIKRGVNVPLARIGTPEDLAGPAVFLASDDAKYVTGSIVFSDGGMLAQQRSATVDIFPLDRFPSL
jgi:3-oxoacyl-[acyl-carrier protein] reductase